MAEEFQTGICGGPWWNPSRSSSLSPCSASGIGMMDHMGSLLWSSSDMVDMKTTTTTTTKSCEESNNSVSADSSMVFQSPQKPQQTDSDSGGSSSILMDSTLQMMSFGPSSSTDWNQALLRGNERAENNYRSMIQDDLNSQMQKDWSPKSFTSAGDDSSINVFKSINQDFPLDQHQLKPVTRTGNCIVTCDGLSAGFPVNSASYGYSSALLQSYFEPDPQPQQSLYNNRSMNYVSTPNYGANSNELSTSWPKISPFLKPSLPKQQLTGLHFSNNTPFWNASASASTSSGLTDIRAGYFPSSQSQFLAPTLEEKVNFPSLNTKFGNGEVRESASVGKKGSSEPPFKRPRIETPSPLPTFKVRKEKLGDRITALQQLVSPFGKTDTASVLHEAIEYIKFLHDQVLTTPYMKQGTQIQQQQVYPSLSQNSDNLKDPEAPKQALKSRGLCLVPISSTFPVTNETTAEFWTPTFGGTYR